MNFTYCFYEVATHRCIASGTVWAAHVAHTRAHATVQHALDLRLRLGAAEFSVLPLQPRFEGLVVGTIVAVWLGETTRRMRVVGQLPNRTLLAFVDFSNSAYIEYHAGSMRRVPKRRPLVRWLSTLIAMELGA